MSLPPYSITYVLEVSESNPRQYRISVLRTIAENLTWRLNRNAADGFKIVADTEDPQALFALIERYVQLEISS
jgi:hypothetical protein